MNESLNRIISGESQGYHCPGEEHPISRSLHLARLSAGWSGCLDCVHRHDPDVDHQSLDEVKSSAEILRTPWGIRGVWQNALGRQQAAQLASVAAAWLHQQREQVEDEATTDAHAVFRPPVVIVGYDGRQSSPDLFAGVVSAVLANGCDVKDAGRMTAASLLEIIRSTPRSVAGFLVTGSGESAAWTGFDLLDPHGQVLSVPWQEFGVSVRPVVSGHATADHSDAQQAAEVVSRLQQGLLASEVAAAGRRPQASTERRYPILRLPEDWVSPTPFRSSRSSGQCQTLAAESIYRSWLRKWFPDRSDSRVACLVSDTLSSERLGWLSQNVGNTFDVTRATSGTPVEMQLRDRVREAHADWGLVVAEDDRFGMIANRFGAVLDHVPLADWLNQHLPSHLPHVTVHLPPEQDRLVLLDAGRPDQGAGQETISDMLAVAGLIARLLNSDLSLPS